MRKVRLTKKRLKLFKENLLEAIKASLKKVLAVKKSKLQMSKRTIKDRILISTSNLSPKHRKLLKFQLEKSNTQQNKMT